MIRILLLLTVLLALAAPATAHADAPPISLRMGANAIGSVYDMATFWRADGSAGMAYDVVPHWYSISFDAHFGNAVFTFYGPMAPGLGVHGLFSAPFSFSIEMGNRLVILHRALVSADIYLSFETTVMRDELTVRRLTIGTDQGTFDITPYVADHTRTEYSWNRITAGTTVYLNLHPLTPKLSVGFERLSITIDELLDDESRGVLITINDQYQQIERSYEDARYSIGFRPGADIGITDRIMLDAEGLILPTERGWIFGGSLGLQYEF